MTDLNMTNSNATLPANGMGTRKAQKSWRATAMANGMGTRKAMKGWKATAMAVLTAAALALTTSGCADARLRQGVEAVNKSCPVNMGLMGTLDSVRYQTGMVTLYYGLNESDFNIETLRAATDAMKESALMLFANPSEQMKEFMESIVDAESKMHVVFTGDISADTCGYTFSTDELRAAIENKDVTPEQKVDAVLRSVNLMMPMELGNGMTLRQMERMGDSVFYRYDVDESLIDMEAMATITNDLKENIKEGLQSMSATEKSDLRHVPAANMTLTYRYQGITSHRQLDITLTVKELSQKG